MNDPYKFWSTSDSKLVKDSELNQQENITETKEVKRSATIMFKSTKSRSSNKTRAKKEKKTEKDETVPKNLKKQNKNWKANKEWTTKQAKKSSLNTKNKQREANIEGENDQDYQIDGLEKKGKNITKEIKRKDKSTENNFKSSNLIENLMRSYMM